MSRALEVTRAETRLTSLTLQAQTRASFRVTLAAGGGWTFIPTQGGEVGGSFGRGRLGAAALGDAFEALSDLTDVVAHVVQAR